MTQPEPATTIFWVDQRIDGYHAMPFQVIGLVVVLLFKDIICCEIAIGHFAQAQKTSHCPCYL